MPISVRQFLVVMLFGVTIALASFSPESAKEHLEERMLEEDENFDGPGEFIGELGFAAPYVKKNANFWKKARFWKRVNPQFWKRGGSRFW
ncbi:hypothetical protein ACTXT7_002039 [Hymenolepis weldensis]